MEGRADHRRAADAADEADHASAAEKTGSECRNPAPHEQADADQQCAGDLVDVRLHQNFNPRSYKGRPLDGVWATAPYLHNGSVPNLWELMKPPDRRVKVFYVGSRELDPVNVGLESSESPGAFKYDTSLPGNSNAGHTYGTQLTEAQKWDLVEFMKSL